MNQIEYLNKSINLLVGNIKDKLKEKEKENAKTKPTKD